MKTPKVSTLNLLCLVAFIIPTASLMSNSIIALYSQDYIKASVIEIGVIVSAFSIASVLLKLPTGLFLPVTKVRITLTVGIFIIATSFFGYAIASNFFSMTLIRIYHGVGDTLFQISALTFIPLVSSTTERSEAISRYTMVYALGMTAGPAISAFSVSTFGMRGTFFLASVLSSAGFFVAFTLIRKVHVERKDFAEKKQVLRPLRSVLSNRVFESSMFAYFAISFAFAMMLTFLPNYVRSTFKFSNEQVTLLFFGYYGVMTIVRFSIGRLMKSFGKKRILVLGLTNTIFMLGFMALSPFGAFFAVAFSLQGLSMGVIYPIGVMRIVDTVDQNELVLATSLYMLGWDLGGTFAPNMLSPVVVTLGVPSALGVAAIPPLIAILILSLA